MMYLFIQLERPGNIFSKTQNYNYTNRSIKRFIDGMDRKQ